MITFFKTVVYVPLYNLFILIMNIPFVDAGIATVVLTVLIKMLLFPLAKKASVTQLKMKSGSTELSAIREKYKDSQERALKEMEFYKKNGINPFSGILTLFIQIPVIYSLYYIFYRSGLPNVDGSLLFSFVSNPSYVSMKFLGLFDVASKSIFLAALAAITSFLQMHFATTSSGDAPNKEDFSQIMARQMKYTMPIIVFIISWQISGVVALYWFVSNVMGIIQDTYIKHELAKNPAYN